MEVLHELKNVIEAWKISKRTILRIIDKGDLSCIRIGTSIRFTEDQLNNYLDKRTLSNKKKKYTYI